MALEFGVGTVVWAGDIRLTLVGLAVLCCTALAYYCELRYGWGSPPEEGYSYKSSSEYEEEGLLLGGLPHSSSSSSSSEHVGGRLKDADGHSPSSKKALSSPASADAVAATAPSSSPLLQNGNRVHHRPTSPWASHEHLPGLASSGSVHQHDMMMGSPSKPQPHASGSFVSATNGKTTHDGGPTPGASPLASRSTKTSFQNGASSSLMSKKPPLSGLNNGVSSHHHHHHHHHRHERGVPQKTPPSTRYVLFSGLAVLLCSVSIVYTNAWIVSRFRYVSTYIMVQQAFCFVAATFAVRVLKLAERVDVSWAVYWGRVAPLGVCFTLYLWGSNSAYVYLQPGLIQMIKPIGSCFVFAHACFFGVEAYTRAKALNFVFISAGTLLTAAPQLLRGVGGVDGSSRIEVVFGVFVLIAAYFCDAYYVVSLQRLQQGDVVPNGAFNPLTTLLAISPIVAGTFFGVSLVAERDALYSGSFSVVLSSSSSTTTTITTNPRGDERQRQKDAASVSLSEGAAAASSDDESISPLLLIFACCVAFAFNLAVMNFIGRLSATAYVVFDYLKDIIILTVAFSFFKETYARNELIGYAVVLLGAGIWQHRKLAARARLERRTTKAWFFFSDDDAVRSSSSSSASSSSSSLTSPTSASTSSSSSSSSPASSNNAPSAAAATAARRKPASPLPPGGLQRHHHHTVSSDATLEQQQNEHSLP